MTMRFSPLSGVRTVAPLAVVLAIGAALGAAPALAQQNNLNPLTSQTPPPGAPATSSPGTSASPGTVNTVPNQKGVSVPPAPSGTATPAVAHPRPAAPRQPATARVETQITRLHRELQITSAEEPQWNAFAQVMRDNAQKLDALYAQREKGQASLNAVADMQSYAEIAKAHSDSVQALIDPFQTLYTAMSDAQKKTADAVFRNTAESGGRAAARRG